MEDSQTEEKKLCLLCEGAFVVKEGLQYAPCPRCNGTGIEPDSLHEIRLGISTFHSERKRGWVTILNVLYSTKPVNKQEIIAVLKDLVSLLEGRSGHSIDLPPKEGQLQ